MRAFLNEDLSINFRYLDQCCSEIYQDGPNFEAAHQILIQFINDPDSWNIVDSVIAEPTVSTNCKFITLTILRDKIRFRWNLMQSEEKELVKTFIISKITEWAHNTQAKDIHALLTMVNMILVEIIKLEWPQQWPNILDDLIISCETDMLMCQNNLVIIQMFSQDVMEFNESTLTSSRWSQLSSALEHIAPQLFNLLQQIIELKSTTQLLNTAFDTLKSLVHWLNPNFIFASSFCQAMCNHFLPAVDYQLHVLGVFGEIASLGNIPDEYLQLVPSIFSIIVESLEKTITPDFNFITLIAEESDFVNTFTFTFISFINQYGPIIEENDDLNSLVTALKWITNIMKTDYQDFKTCCEMWTQLSIRLVKENSQSKIEFYEQFLPEIRRIFAHKIELPLEFYCLKESEDIIMETEQFVNINSLLYTIMKDGLKYMAIINPQDAQDTITEMLSLVKNEWSPQLINSVCWSAGAISGIMNGIDEQKFVILVLRDLLMMFKASDNSEKNAVLTTCIIFLVPQYPRFLVIQWNYAQILINKIFEFMQNQNEKIREMAVIAFLTIAQRCRKRFHRKNSSEKETFLSAIFNKMSTIKQNLTQHLLVRFFEAVAIIIGMDEIDPERFQHIRQLISYIPPIVDISDSTLLSIKINFYIVSRIGPHYYDQMSNLYQTLNDIFLESSRDSTYDINLVYELKVWILRTIEAYIRYCPITPYLYDNLIPNVLDNLLTILYQINGQIIYLPYEFVLLRTIYKKVAANAKEYQNEIFLKVLLPVFDLAVTEDQDDYIELKTECVSFLQVLVKQCPEIIEEYYPDGSLSQIINFALICFSNDQRELSSESTELLLCILEIVECLGDFKCHFYQTYGNIFFTTVFMVMTDGYHKFEFTTIIKLFKIILPLYDTTTTATYVFSLFPTNEVSFYESILSDILVAISQPDSTLYNQLMTDFIILLKQYTKSDPDLQFKYQEEILIEEQYLAYTEPSSEANEYETDNDKIPLQMSDLMNQLDICEK